LFNANPMGRASATPRAEGGIVTKPELSLVGEAGPEAIIPLSQLGGMGGNSVTVNVGNYMGDELSKRALVRDIQRILNEEDRRRQYQPTKTNFYSVGGHL
jgi:SLT domain-containing protein